MIPKRIHHVWVGSTLPEAQRRCVDTWRETNPGFDLVLWNEDNIDFSHPALRAAYEKRLWAKVADIVRLKAVAESGGFYLDTDFRLFRPLDPLLGHACVFGFQTQEASADWVANGMMAAGPGHWFIVRALERLLSMRAVPFGLDRPTRYGPKLVTRLLVEEGLRRYDSGGVRVKDVFICPTQAFFPWPFGVAFREDFVTAESYGVHLWEKSWEANLPGYIRAVKQARRWAGAALRPAAR